MIKKKIILLLIFMVVCILSIGYSLSAQEYIQLLNKTNNLRNDIKILDNKFKFVYSDLEQTVPPQIFVFPFNFKNEGRFNRHNSVFMLTQNKEVINPSIFNIFTGDKINYTQESFINKPFKATYYSNKITIFYLLPQVFVKKYDVNNLTVQSIKLDIKNNNQHKSLIYKTSSSWLNGDYPTDFDLAMVTSGKTGSIVNFINPNSLRVSKYSIKTTTYGGVIAKYMDSNENEYFMFGGYDKRTQKRIKGISVINIKSGSVSKISNLTEVIIDPILHLNTEYSDLPPISKRPVNWVLFGKTLDGKFIINSFDEVTKKTTEYRLPSEVQNATSYWGIENSFYNYSFFLLDKKIFVVFTDWEHLKFKIIAKLNMDSSDIQIVRLNTNKMNKGLESFLIFDNNKIKLLALGRER